MVKHIHVGSVMNAHTRFPFLRHHMVIKVTTALRDEDTTLREVSVGLIPR